jgi:gliding motility-associated-like protein
MKVTNSITLWVLNAAAILLFSLNSYGQTLPNVSLCLGEDATVCLGQGVTINNCGGSAGIAPQGGIFLNSPTNLTLSDDQWSGVINMGFTFNFYGTNHTQCVVGSNGLVSFNLANANTNCAYSLTAVGTLPNAGFAAARNTAMGCYQDMNPAAGGTVKYQTVGAAPNRIFIVLYENVVMFNAPDQCNYMSFLFYETSNVVEYHIGNKPIAAAWNNGLAIQGTENPAGTVAHITPGRNNTQWTAIQDARRFTPTSPTNTNDYTITTIPYLTVTSPGTTMGWANTLGQTFQYNNGVLNITSVPAGTTGYFISGSACGVGVGAVSDTTWITRVSSSVTASSTTDFCSSSSGTVTATPTQGTPPFTFDWPTLGQTTQTVSNVLAGSYTVLMTDGLGCPSSATVVVGNSDGTYSSTFTPVSCQNGNDGSATAVMTPVIGNLTYQWDDPLGQTSQTATGLSAGTYTCMITSDTGCFGTTTVTVNEIPGMTAVLTNQSNVSCNSGNDGLLSWTVSNGTAPYSFSWDNSSSTLASANDLSVGAHVVTVTDLNGCTATFSATLNEPSPLQISFLTNDLMICPENEATLEVTGTGGSSPYTFTWFQNGVYIGTGSSIVVDPSVTNSQYCVVMSEACGSPTTDSCMVITFPTPIIPQLTPNQSSACMPGEFTFTNTSENAGEIATMFVQFSEGSTFMLNGIDPVTMTLTSSGFYGVELTATSVYGCVYTNVLNNIVQVLPLPIANFNFSANPTTYFETSITMQNASTQDVVSWDWFSPYSNPAVSQSENPLFVFPEGEEGLYPVTLLVTTAEGCMDTVTYYLNVIPSILFFAPNSFTPDGDEYNQQWEFFVSGIDVYNFELSIFNRWGEVIWETKDPSATWDGTYNGERLQTGMYVWKASVKDPYSDLKKEFTGHINVLR